MAALLLGCSIIQAESLPIDTSRSTVTVHVFKTGLFSGLAHDHSIRAPIASGVVDAAQLSVSLAFKTAEMKVVDPEGSESEHQEIEATMKGPKVLDAARFPEIAFRSKAVRALASQHYEAVGELTLHGVTREVSVPVMVESGLYRGAVKIRQSEFGMTSVKIAGGAVRVKDEIEVEFAIAVR